MHVNREASTARALSLLPPLLSPNVSHCRAEDAGRETSHPPIPSPSIRTPFYSLPVSSPLSLSASEHGRRRRRNHGVEMLKKGFVEEEISGQSLRLFKTQSAQSPVEAVRDASRLGNVGVQFG